MDVTYSVTWENRVAGQVRLVRSGLYTELSCRCDLPTGEIYRLWVSAGEKSVNLGVLYPDSEGFCLRRRVPAHQIPTENPVFSIRQKAEISMRFVPVREDEPFAYLPLLMHSRFAIRDGVPGLLIPDER